MTQASGPDNHIRPMRLVFWKYRNSLVITLFLTTPIGQRKKRENEFEIWVKTTQIKSLGTKKDEIIKLEVISVKNWKNW